MNVLVSDFLAYLSSERVLSKNTNDAYSVDLDQFETFCIVKRVVLERATLKVLRDFVAHLRGREASHRTIARKVSALKQFYKFLLREEKIDSDPSELLSIRIKTKKLPKHLTSDEIASLLSAAEGATETEVRDRALLELWYATGCRVTELATLAADAIDWKEAVVRVMGKRSRERLIPVHQRALEWCRKYKDIRHEWVRRNALKETRLFFLTQQGKGFKRQGIWRMVKRYGKKAGIARNIWPHMIRHTFATHILQNGADLRAVQELLGHRSIGTTEIYTHLDIENLKQMQLKYHPRG